MHFIQLCVERVNFVDDNAKISRASYASFWCPADESFSQETSLCGVDFISFFILRSLKEKRVTVTQDASTKVFVYKFN